MPARSCCILMAAWKARTIRARMAGGGVWTPTACGRAAEILSFNSIGWPCGVRSAA